MVRFKVVKASHLLLIASILVLLAAVLFVALHESTMPSEDTRTAAITVQHSNNQEARANEAFASLSNAPNPLIVEIIPDSPEANSGIKNKGNILIYHTHTHEAYEQDPKKPYVALEAWRTADPGHNVTHLGGILAEELRSLGYQVTHDTTNHESDSLDHAYLCALETLESYDVEFDLCIDLHRDAYVDGLPHCVASDSGVEYAQMMCLVGRGDNYADSEKPDYETNLDFARKLTTALNRQVSNICRNVTIKSGRYNQHIADKNLLIEVGHNKNTLAQALNSIPVLAKGIDSAI